MTRARYVAWWSVSELSESVLSSETSESVLSSNEKGWSVEMESPSESLDSDTSALYELVFSLSLPLVLGFVSVLIDDCLPGLSEFKTVDYWCVGYLCVSSTEEISTGSETYSGRFWFWFWVEMCGGSGIKDEFVFVVCVVHG